MWKIELPYAPGEKVVIATCNHLGRWNIEQCEVSHYIVTNKEVTKKRLTISVETTWITLLIAKL